MKYYAVTDDINELYHYGVKGMKWGQHIFGEDRKPRSAGYKRAASKLRSLTKKSRNDIETRSDRRYQKQIERALKRTALSKEKHKWDQVADGIKANDRAFRAAQREEKNLASMRLNQQKYIERQIKNEAKQARKAAKAEKRFDRYLQDAREGHLRAGNLSNEQIQRINDRLNAERMARQLGGSEKASYRKRRREAIREGKLEGYKRGTAAGMEALAKGLVEMGVKSRLVKAANNRSEARRQRVKNRIVNKKSYRDIRREAKEESYRDNEKEFYKNTLYNPDLLGIERLAARVPGQLGYEARRRLTDSLKDKSDNGLSDQQKSQLYFKIVQGQKNDSPKEILARLNNPEIRNAIYNSNKKESHRIPKTGNKTIDYMFEKAYASQKNSEPISKQETEPLFVTYDNSSKQEHPRVPKTPIQKAIDRQKKKQARKLGAQYKG